MKNWILCFLLCGGFISVSVHAEPKLGQQFKQTLKPIATDAPEKIEVMELFWYGCSHCYQMEKPLTDWVKKLPADVYFKRMPALGSRSWEPMANTFFIFKRIAANEKKPEIFEKLHQNLFKSIHEDKTISPHDRSDALRKWIVEQTNFNFQTNYNLLDVTFFAIPDTEDYNMALHIFRDSGATGVPALIIDGKYITSPGMAGGYDAALETADYLIEKVRKEKAH